MSRVIYVVIVVRNAMIYFLDKIEYSLHIYIILFLAHKHTEMTEW